MKVKIKFIVDLHCDVITTSAPAAGVGSARRYDCQCSSSVERPFEFEVIFITNFAIAVTDTIVCMKGERTKLGASGHIVTIIVNISGGAIGTAQSSIYIFSLFDLAATRHYQKIIFSRV